jgi:hypothetical protein
MPGAAHGPIGAVESSPGSDLFEVDEHAWIAAQVAALTDGQLNRLDRDHLAQYLTETTIRDRRELRSRLTVPMHHLFKIRLQPDRLTRRWIMPTIEQQSEIRSIIEGIPSLGRQAEAIATKAYPDAVRRAVRETGIARARFPTVSPWTLQEALEFDPPEPAARGKRLA